MAQLCCCWLSSDRGTQVFLGGKKTTFQQLNPHGDLDLKGSNPVFFYDDPSHDSAPPYKVRFHTSGSKDIVQRKNKNNTKRKKEDITAVVISWGEVFWGVV